MQNSLFEQLDFGAFKEYVENESTTESRKVDEGGGRQ